MRQIKFALTLAALFLLTLIPVSAQKAVTPKVKIAFQETTLKNGLRVITVEDHTAPVVSQVLYFDVGSAHEREGRTGFAHLFEHMMFKGTENVKSMSEYLSLIMNNGGSMDAFTGADQTVYFEVVPANQFELPLFLESDRMRGLLITQELLDIERKIVQEERRMRIDNQPYGKSGERLNELLYDNFAYKHQLMGSMEDLSAASVEDVREFFKTYYAPNNVVLVLVGDFKTAEMIGKVKKYFEDIPRQPKPAALNLTEPEQKEERRATMEDALARAPMLAIAFKAVSGNTPDYYALQILSSVLTSGQSSRLYQKLVKEKELATAYGEV
ncbi:MAG: insulinase family protein [Pyrinomonadaceae bacterium]|nr:insulinase family protein [Pyrinomonadaceae bacterium]